MKRRIVEAVLVLVLLILVGCGKPFVLQCDPPQEQKTLIIFTGPVEYPTGSVVAQPPLPPRSTRPAPDAGAAEGGEGDASDLDASMQPDASDADAGVEDDAAPLGPDEGEDLDEQDPSPARAEDFGAP